MMNYFKIRKYFQLDNYNIGDEDIKILGQRLKGSEVTVLDLSYNRIGDIGVKYLAEVLKDTQITYLNLSRNVIADGGATALSEHLKDSRVSHLDLSYNNIGDEGAKKLAEILQDTQVNHIDLKNNNVGIDGAQYLDQAQDCRNGLSLHLDIYYCRDRSNFISITSSYNSDLYFIVNVTLYGNVVEANGANYLNQRFKTVHCIILTLDCDKWEIVSCENLALAFNDVEIMKLILFDSLIMQPNGIQYFVRLFNSSRIMKLTFIGVDLGISAKYVSDLLKVFNVIDFDIVGNWIQDEGVKYLVSALKNNTVMKLLVSWNNIGCLGAKYLADVLKDTRVTHVDLSNNRIGIEGAKYLANGLKHSQVTYLNLQGNMIEYEGYQYLINAVKDTNLCWIDLHCNGLEEGLEEGIKFGPYRIQRNHITFAESIKNAFRKLISLNPLTNEFEFILSKTDISSVNIDIYVFFMKSLSDNPKVKVHIFDMMCRNGNDRYDFNLMNKVNEFITKIWDKFNLFFNNNLLSDLLQEIYNYDCINFIKQFQDMRSYGIVQNLLLHRGLYYVDDNKEILHPYIYKLLKEYNMPLYMKDLEPNKKETIISYFKNHSEIDGAKEVIDLL